MDYLLATNSVAPLPQRLSSLPQRLANLVIADLVSKAEIAFCLQQLTALEKLMPDQLMGGSSLQWSDPQQPVLGLLTQGGVLPLLFRIGLKPNFEDLLKVGSYAPTLELVGMVVPFVLLCNIAE